MRSARILEHWVIADNNFTYNTAGTIWQWAEVSTDNA
jgi:hypothetical protein